MTWGVKDMNHGQSTSSMATTFMDLPIQWLEQ